MYSENFSIEALERIARALEASNELASERNHLLRKLLEKSGSSMGEGLHEWDDDPLVGSSNKRIEDDEDLDPLAEDNEDDFRIEEVEYGFDPLSDGDADETVCEVPKKNEKQILIDLFL